MTPSALGRTAWKVISGIDIIVSSAIHFNINTFDHMKMNILFVGRRRTLPQCELSASSESIQVNNLERQVHCFVFPGGSDGLWFVSG